MTDTDPPDTGAAAATPSPGAEPAKGDAKTTTDFAIPDAYKDKPYVAKIKTQDDLWKQLDNTQALVGKKAVVPDFEKGDPKDIEAYVAQLRPKDKSGYKLSETIPEDDRGVIAGILHDTGLPASMANKLMEGLMTHLTGSAQKMFDKDGFDKILETSFGEKWKDAGGQTAKIIAGLVTESDRELLEKVPNQYLGLVYRITAAMEKKYGAKETGAGAEGGEGASGPVDKTAERKAIRAEITALKSGPHSDDDRLRLNDKLADTYK